MTRPPDAHLEAALKWLDRAPLSRRRLIDKMTRAGWDEAESHRVADRLAAMGAIDDEAMGRALIEEIQSRKPAGPALLRARLLQRGLDDDLIDRLIQETTEHSDADLVADAAALARKRLRSLERFVRR